MDPREYAASFEAMRVNQLRHETQASETPRAVIVLGQSGTATHALAADFQKELRGAAIVSESMIARSYADNLKLPASEAATQAAASAARIADGVAFHRRDLIIQTTGRDPAAIEAMAAALDKAGYRTQVEALAVNELYSQTRSHVVVEASRRERVDARAGDAAGALAEYRGVAETVSRLETSRTVDRITVRDVGLKEVTSVPGRNGPTGAADALKAHRSTLSAPTKAQLAAALDNAAEASAARNAPAAERDAIDQLRARVHYAVQASPEARREYAEAFAPSATAERSSERLAASYGEELAKAIASPRPSPALAARSPELQQLVAARTVLLKAFEKAPEPAREAAQSRITERLVESARNGASIQLDLRVAPTQARTVEAAER